MITRCRRRPEQIQVNAMVISISNGAPYRATIESNLLKEIPPLTFNTIN